MASQQSKKDKKSKRLKRRKNTILSLAKTVEAENV